jgi:hypothetical protein
MQVDASTTWQRSAMAILAWVPQGQFGGPCIIIRGHLRFLLARDIVIFLFWTAPDAFYLRREASLPPSTERIGVLILCIPD